jgi:dolichyl-phosphate-mannose-protein mannosyltransferase
VIAPIFRFASSPNAYLLVKVVNCVLFSLAAAPAYLLARRVLTRRTALVLAGLAVFVPSAVYTSKVMTESLSYPLFLVALLGIVRALEARTWRREAVAIAGIVLAALSRGQLIVLLPAFLVAVAALATLDQRDERRNFSVREVCARMGSYRVTWLAGLAAAVALVVASRSGVAHEVAGGHGEAFAGVDLTALGLSFLYHLAELDLYLGLLPLAAFAFICPLAFRRTGDRSLRILCVLTLALTPLLAAAAARYLVAIYANAPDPYLRVYDRYQFYVVPLYLIAFLVWLERGRVRPKRRVALVIGLVAAALPAILPFADLLNGREWGSSSSTVALVPWAILRLSGTVVAVYAVLAVGGAALVYALLRSDNSRRLVFLVAANFAVITLFAQAGNSNVAQRALHLGVGSKSQRAWVDKAVGSNAEVSVLWSGVAKRSWRGWYPIWEGEFFNSSIRKVYELREPMRYPLPAVRLQTRGHDLFLSSGKPFVADYVLTDVKTPVGGELIASNSATGMTLYRVDGRVRLR